MTYFLPLSIGTVCSVVSLLVRPCVCQEFPVACFFVAGDQMEWPASLTLAVAGRVRALREERGWSAEQLAEQLTAIGMPTRRSALANFENGRRREIGLHEVFAFARVFRVPPALVLGEPLDQVEVLPGAEVAVYRVSEWFGGAELSDALIFDDDEISVPNAYLLAAEPMRALRQHAELLAAVIDAYMALPSGVDLDFYRRPLAALVAHRSYMRYRGAQLERLSLWCPPEIPDPIGAAVEAAERRILGPDRGARSDDELAAVVAGAVDATLAVDATRGEG